VRVGERRERNRIRRRAGRLRLGLNLATMDVGPRLSRSNSIVTVRVSLILILLASLLCCPLFVSFSSVPADASSGRGLVLVFGSDKSNYVKQPATKAASGGVEGSRLVR
jgi:hypothetical protein